jgi:hypothetical protein
VTSDQEPGRDTDGRDRPETTPTGTATLYLWGTLALFGAFLVAVPGREPAARTWLWVGLVLLALAVPGLARALRARRHHLRKDEAP